MKNKLKMIFDISNFEPVNENSENKLVGGFSESISSIGQSLELIANNCNGANCYSGCGEHHATVIGCGVAR